MKINAYMLVLVVGLAGFSPVMAAPAQLSVQIESAQIREKPSVFGKIVANAKYGDRLDVVTKMEPWIQVRTADGKTGWMHESSLSRKKVELSAGSQDVNRTASGEELAMAGKGFNSKVEADFKAKNQNIDFTWIDRMEKIKVSERDSISFLQEGGLGR